MDGGIFKLAVALLLAYTVVLSGCTQQTAIPPANQPQQTPPETPELPPSPSESPATDPPSISVSSQQLTDGKIVVDSLFLDKPGFVVIHKDEAGKSGAVIGNSNVISGIIKNFAVSLDDSQAGTRLWVMLHYDDNDNGIYEFPAEDKPIFVDGAVLVKPLEIIQPQPPQPAPQTVEIQMTSSGFNPSSVTIKAGDIVTFVNNDNAPHWVASNPHPTHTNYPGFDAHRGLAGGESWSFTFDNVGTWGYHDHFNPSRGGTIIVQ